MVNDQFSIDLSPFFTIGNYPEVVADSFHFSFAYIMTSKYSKLLLAAGIALVLAAIAAYIVLVKIPTDLATSIAHGVQETFNFTPQVKVEETVIIEQNVSIYEIAIVSRDIAVEYAWSHQWLGSTKTIVLRAAFTAKAGFDLKKPFTIIVERNPLRVRANMPAPELLSIQMNTYKVLRDEDGWWNKVSVSDRELAVQELQRIAREKAQNSGMLADARSTIEERIKEIVERNGAMVEFKYPWQE